MKPVAICRYAPHEGPGYFATYLTAHRIPWRLVKIDEGDVLPELRDISGLGLMGGPMSVNDDLPWIAPMLELIRASVARDVPVIGHCLGGQLMSKALGGNVTRNAVKEIGWGRVDVSATPLASEWGQSEPFDGYHWHGETFSVPTGAERIWYSAHCENQAFALSNHFAMQCHMEMTEDLIVSWCETGAHEIDVNLARSPAVQTPQAMRENMDSRLGALHAVADRIYRRWTAGLAA
ncbi:MAG TPA: type 1 glutamine amidotransferase [Burkholderiales bacterium]|nr:type 1 glutamine amidotransferase [Burkholderiales bacterium]